jgi:hypothetical protein
MDLEQKVLQKIKQNDLHMRSSLFFYAKDVFICVASCVLLALSALFLGISIALIVHLIREISSVNFPYSLIVSSFILAFLAYELFIRAFSFYKVRFSVGVLIVFLLIFSFGYTMFVVGQAERIERTFQRFPTYRVLVPYSFQEHEKNEALE